MAEETRQRERGVRGRRIRAATWLAWSLWTLCVVLAAFAVLLALNTPRGTMKGNSYLGVVIAVPLLTYPTVGAFVAARHPKNLVGWILCGLGLLFVTEGFALVYASYALSAQPGSLPGEKIAQWVSGWFAFPILYLGAALLVLLFPDGRLPTRSWRAVPWLAVGGSVLWTLWLATEPGRPVYWILSFGLPHPTPFAVRGALGDAVEGFGRLGSVAILMMCVASVIGVFVRLGDSRGEERQQIKWFAYSAALLLGIPFVVAIPVGIIAADVMGASFDIAFASIVIVIVTGLLGIPLTVGIAIRKYRLYEVDVIINRTLVYGLLTATLLLIYVGGVAATQTIVQKLTSQEELPQLVIVISTLVIAALFTPLRRRIQGLIDRIFYRRKYDAAKTLEAFAAKLRNETDLDALSADVTSVVKETMQPSHVSLWLRPMPSPRRSLEHSERLIHRSS